MDVVVIDLDTVDGGGLTDVLRRLRELRPAMTVIVVGRQAPQQMSRLVSELTRPGAGAAVSVRVSELAPA